MKIYKTQKPCLQCGQQTHYWTHDIRACREKQPVVGSHHWHRCTYYCDPECPADKQLYLMKVELLCANN